MLTGTARQSREAQAVYQQLREDFPKESCSWVLDKAVRWMPLRRVPLALIDYSKAASWDAANHKAKIGHFRDKITEGDDKPIILVMRPGKSTGMVADGHHRALAAREEHRAPRAWLCIVPAVNGPWDAMHDAQRGSKGQVKLAAEVAAPPQQQAPPTDQQLALETAAVLAAATGPAAATAALLPPMTRAGLHKLGIYAVIDIVMSFPPDQQGMIGPATANILRLNSVRRAQFVVAAARRVTSDIAQALSQDESVLAVVRAAAARERRYYGQHLQATWNRMDAAARVDSAAMMLGTVLLGWNTVLDARTSAECRAANGKNFRADIMPSIGYPGMVHPHCRCYPGRARPRARLLS